LCNECGAMIRTVPVDGLEAAFTEFATTDINGGAIIDHEAPRERRFVAVEK
jgi:hypothetical protein